MRYSNLAIIAVGYIILGVFLTACATAKNMTKKDISMPLTKIVDDTPEGPVKAVVILLHGLNLKPSKMDDWVHLLLAGNAEVIRFALHGHSGDYQQMAEVTADMWREQFQRVAAVARGKARERDVPLYFIGFSLGALVALEWLSSVDEQAFERMVLIAPALSIPWYSRAAIHTLSIFGNGFMLPSRSPQNYRANPGTSIAAYKSLFELKDALEEKKYRNANVPTLVLIDRHDELVDSRNIGDVIMMNKLSLWSLELVDNRFAHDNFGFRHLMVDEEAMGKALWSKVRELVIEHLSLRMIDDKALRR